MRKSVHTAEYEALCCELRTAREAAGLSQRALAASLGVPHSVVAKIESGERRIDLVEFCWFMDACGAEPQTAFAAVYRRIRSPRAARKARGGRSL